MVSGQHVGFSQPSLLVTADSPGALTAAGRGRFAQVPQSTVVLRSLMRFSPLTAPAGCVSSRDRRGRFITLNVCSLSFISLFILITVSYVCGVV